jgi:hypothetical protein
MGFFLALGALHAVQYFIAPVDTWSSLLLASKTHRVIEVANEPWRGWTRESSRILATETIRL